MSFLKKHKTKIIIAAAVAIILGISFWWGGDAPALHGWRVEPDSSPIISEATKSPKKTPKPSVSPTQASEETASPQPTSNSEVKASKKPTTIENNVPIKKQDEEATVENKPEKEDNTPLTAEEKIEVAEQMAEEMPYEQEVGDEEYSIANGMDINEATGMDQYQTEPVPNGEPLPFEPQDTEITDKELKCTLSVRCDTILENMAWLDLSKHELVPKDGVIFPEQEVTFYDGESVFNLLLREMKKNKIHMEFESTPMYNSVYIEGINNLYEYDCGELSGWMYKVNDWFPNYGCSRYRLKEGDKVEFVYTCNLGLDVGGYRSSTGE
jgi:hypothetical protein